MAFLWLLRSSKCGVQQPVDVLGSQQNTLPLKARNCSLSISHSTKARNAEPQRTAFPLTKPLAEIQLPNYTVWEWLYAAGKHGCELTESPHSCSKQFTSDCKHTWACFCSTSCSAALVCVGGVWCVLTWGFCGVCGFSCHLELRWTGSCQAWSLAEMKPASASHDVMSSRNTELLFFLHVCFFQGSAFL